ncbi:glycosyltransferase family 4 protein [Ramlibacter tataouinensis]|uniref:glycosyltransferase family 4 protein n=1 Tax=Ramlibacter tataouinensis TaxID=94132 RepID=UPI0022F3BE5C|nr:glycosyltransferase family 4 protein [Ramlibacter tataouinensis]WBY02076.1 glycosyltransferase family 4 protein [Ramlibacter tataouinensis]
MKIILVASFPDSIIDFRGALISALLESGVEVHVAAPGLALGTPIRNALDRMGVVAHDYRLRRTGTEPVADLRTLVDLWSLFRRIRPDCVLSYTIKPVIYGTLAAWLARVPRRLALITGLGYAFMGEGRRGRLHSLVKRMYAVALSRVHCVIFQNSDDRLLFSQIGIVPSHVPTCVVNGSGIDTAKFSVVPLPSGPVRFLLIARLLGDKGVREFANAAARVKVHNPDVSFTIVGWIDESPDAIEQDELKAWIADGIIEFPGRLSDVRPAIGECTVYVLPSYREGTPRTVLEAMAMGRPIITTDAPGCRETVTDGDNGFLVPVKSVDALEFAMLKFIGDPTLASRMGQRSRQIAESKYDVHQVNARMLQELGVR